MATHYLHKFADAAHFASESPERSNAFPFAAVIDADGHAGVANIVSLSDAAYGVSSHYDLDLTKVTIAATITAANGLNAKRGEVNLTSGKTVGNGVAASYVTGVYGRVNFNSATIDITSGDLAAVYAKFDMNGATLTSGHIAPLQANIVNPPAGAGAAGVSLAYLESASGTVIGQAIEIYTAANYLLKVTEVGANFFLDAGTGANSAGVSTGAVAAKVFKINVGGTAYYIPLCSSNA